MRGARGFTLVELLVSLALAGLLVAGALQIHINFNSASRRQAEITEVQQTLRVAMLVIERTMRAAGAGMALGELRAEYGAGLVRYYGVQFSNSNTYADPKTTFDSTPGNDDTDPDWFRVITADNANVYSARLPAGGDGHQLEVNTLTGWQVGDVLQVNNPTGSGLTPCARQVTGTLVATPPRLVMAAGDSRGFNMGGIDDTCIKASKFPAPIRRFPMAATVFRVSNDRLMMRTSALGTAETAAAWTTLAEGIEDMQVAVVLLDGRVCGESGTNMDVDDPALCDFSKATAVRVTLVAKSSSVQGGLGEQITGGYEDRPGVKVSDGFFRRSMTSQFHLRNVVAP